MCCCLCWAPAAEAVPGPAQQVQEDGTTLKRRSTWLSVCAQSRQFLCVVAALGWSNMQVAAAYGCHCFIAMPDDAAIEKAQLLQALGEFVASSHAAQGLAVMEYAVAAARNLLQTYQAVDIVVLQACARQQQ